MPSENALALVLRVTEFSETSIVATLFTREAGKVRALAKGARRPKGPFESALDLLSLCRIVFLRKSSDALDLLTEAKLERRFRAAACGLSSLYAGYYVAELLNELTDVYDPHPDLFDAADHALRRLEGEDRVGPLVLRFELTALRLLGHLPSLTTCVECGEETNTTGRVSFALAAGGVLCRRCRPGKKQVAALSQQALDAMKWFAEPEEQPCNSTDIDYRASGELRGVVNHYLAHLLGHRPRMHAYLGLLSS